MSVPPEIMAKALAQVAGPGAPFEIVEHKLETAHTSRVFKGFARGLHTLPEYFQHWLAVHADAPFVVFQHERLTFRQFEAKAAAVARALLAPPYSVRVGDRVAISMRNYPEWPMAYAAAASIGAVVVPMNSWWKEKEMAYGLADSGTRVLFCDEERLAYAQPSLPAASTFAIVVRSSKAFSDPLVANFADVFSHGASLSDGTMPYALTHVGPDAPAGIMYTSGTTGNPKGVVQSQRGVCDQMLMAQLGKAVTEAVCQLTGAPVPAAEGQPCIVCPVPLFHVTGSHHIFLACLPEGRKLCLMYKWDPAEALRLIETERATGWTGVPTMVQDMVNHPDFAKRDTSSLKSIGGGGAPTPTANVAKIDKAFKGGRPGNGYGLTETNGAICVVSGDDYVANPGSCGQAFPIADAKTVDVNTQEDLPRGEAHRGELLIKSSLVMLEYYNKPEKTAEALTPDGWFRTGDIAVINEEGFIFIVDRIKDIVIRGGENISCSEVENAFYKAEGVLECTAIGVPDERLGEDIAVMVYSKVLDAGSAMDLVRGAQGLLAAFKVPKPHNVYFTSDPLPRGATGKILKQQVRKDVAAMHKSKL